MKKEAAKIITMFSCKGGVGKTTTAINLAGIYSLMDKKVLIMDLDLNSGGVAISLNVDVNKTIYNVADDMSNNRFDEINSYVSKYNDKIDVLSAPKDPRNAMKIDSKYISLVITSAIYKYDVILIDTSHNISPVLLTALDKSDNALFMITNDPVDLKNARSMISIFKDTDNNNYKVVFNSSKDTGKDYFSLFDVKNIIKHNIDYTIDKSFYIKDIDKYVIDGEILTLNKKIRLSKKGDIMKLTKLANALLESKPAHAEVKKMPKLMEAFDVKEEKTIIRPVADYDIFKDKELLDNLRNSIISNLIDDKIPNNKLLHEYINDEIDKALLGYDLTNLERSHIFNLIDNEINGYGPITELLEDPNITEIMVNGKNEVYVEIDGQISKDDSVSFINDEHIIRTIQKIVQPLGRTIDTANPMVDARLEDGSRLNAVIPPLSLKGPVVTIRKFRRDMESIDDFLRTGSMTPYMARFLDAAVRAKLNIIICGGTGSGKTTLLNALSSFIGDHERIITIEDAAELRLHQSHVIGLETRLVNYEGTGEVTIRDLVINSLRMRPDRIIVGEVRGKEAFDMLQAMNTGHDGSLTTMHANSPAEALNRLETMVLMAGMEIPIKAIREYIENAIDIVINISRLSDGRRKVTSICEVDGFKDDIIELKEIFNFKQTGLTSNGEVDGAFDLKKRIPNVYKKMKSKGIDDLEDIFNLKK